MNREKDKTIGFRARILCLLTAGALLLGGCTAAGADPSPNTVPPTEYTVPADGNPEDATCLGSYTRPFQKDQVVASAGKAVLKNGELNIFYHMAINQFRPEPGKPGPDFSLPLEGQLTENHMTWQQFFLEQALDLWHTVQALEQKSREPSTREEENFAPSQHLHETYMKDVPANRVLYSLDNTFAPNQVHQDFLDGIPEMLETLAKDRGYADAAGLTAAEFGAEGDLESFQDAVRLINYAYMYFTELTYDQEPEEDQVLEAMEPSGDSVVDMRQILLIPEGGTVGEDGRVEAAQEQWDQCESWAKDMVNKWNQGMKSQAIFANRAHDLSQDNDSAFNGGLYANIHPGQLIEPLDRWCFDPERDEGDVGAVKSDYGWHVLYLWKIRDGAYDETVSRLKAEKMAALVNGAREAYPMEVTYEKITLTPVSGQGSLSVSGDLLYPDVAHERICEVPVYIQQDYLKAPYGGYNVSSHGCGITSLAMLATYMSDTILTPGMLAARYGSYNSEHGTDAQIFYKTPPDMGFYVQKRCYDWDEAKQSLWEGRKVINLQHKGYFTRGGHYLVLSEIHEGDMIVIRDSNVYNYKRLPEHSVDLFPFSRIPPSSQGFYVYDYKILRIPTCSRCGLDPENHSHMLQDKDYLCPKCLTAIDRRNSFLNLTGLS